MVDEMKEIVAERTFQSQHAPIRTTRDVHMEAAAAVHGKDASQEAQDRRQKNPLTFFLMNCAASSFIPISYFFIPPFPL